MSCQSQKDKVCLHQVVWRDMCGKCGMDLTKLDIKLPAVSNEYVSMVHTVPDLKVSIQDAKAIDKDEETRLLKDKKLHLLVDLDQTLIHTTNDVVPPNLENVFHFQLMGPMSPWNHTRIRPGTREFLESISSLYRLHICTFGSRGYAHIIAKHLDPDGKYFHTRILSREECFSQNSKTANLKDLFPNGDHMVCIIDDREDVWNFAPNLIHVKPYHFFRHTGDINAPPGLAKKDEDDKSGIDFSNLDKNAKVISADSEPKENLPADSLVATDGDTEEEVDKSKGSQACKNEDGEVIKNEKSDSIEKEEGELTTGSSISQVVGGKEEDKNSDDLDGKPEMAATKEQPDVESSPSLEDVIKVEDKDDYLLYLEDILRKIHQAYYMMYSEEKAKDSKAIVDVKYVIPYVRKKVLKGCNIVFSGVVPVDHSLEKSRAYNIAASLGAHVGDRVIPPPKPNLAGSSREMTPTTHLIAARPGTAKVHEARRYKNIQLVTPDWLWCCAERWERADEKLFPLYKKPSARKSPAHGSSPEAALGQEGAKGDEELNSQDFDDTGVFNESGQHAKSKSQTPGLRRERTASGRFMDTINPLFSFSVDELESMEHEVDDISNDSDSSSSSSEKESDSRNKVMMISRRKMSRSQSLHEQEMLGRIKHATSSSSSSDNEDSSREGYDPRKRKLPRTETETEDEPIAAKFRRGEPLPSDVDTLNLNPSSDDDDDVQEEIDEENQMMARDLERQLFGEGFDESSQDS